MKEIIIGKYKYSEYKNCSHSTDEVPGLYMWNKLIKENGLTGKQLEVVLRVKEN